jgi:hypothetical protein
MSTNSGIIRGNNLCVDLFWFLGCYPACYIYWPTFRKTLSLPSSGSKRSKRVLIYHFDPEDGIDKVFRIVSRQA